MCKTNKYIYLCADRSHKDHTVERNAFDHLSDAAKICQLLIVVVLQQSVELATIQMI